MGSSSSLNFISFLKTPVGVLRITSSQTHILEIKFVKSSSFKNTSLKKMPFVQVQCRKQLEEYFLGKRTEFDLPLLLEGTPFQNRTWRALGRIPFGKTYSYKQIAKQVKSPKAFRAVGMANNKNPFPIVLACHRVIGSDGSLVGFGPGIKHKKWLLKHEGAL